MLDMCVVWARWYLFVQVRVVPVDLRWGLTSEDTSDTGLGALEHCLLEIDHWLVSGTVGFLPVTASAIDRVRCDVTKRWVLRVWHATAVRCQC